MPTLPRRMAAAAVVAAILVATLSPATPPLPSFRVPPASCLTCEFALADVANNLVLFAPFGAAVAWLGRGPLPAAVAGTLLSLLIELLQGLIPGRFPSARDVLLNGASAWLGTLLWRAAARAWRAPLPTRRRLAGGWLALVAGTLLATTALLRPWLPAERLWPQWGHLYPGRERYAGRLLAARLGGVPLPDDSLPRATSALLAAGAGDSVVLEVETELPAVPQRDAPLLLVSDGHGLVPVGIEMTGADFAAALPLRTVAAGLRRPRFLLRGAAARFAGRTVRLRLVVTPGRASLRAEAAGAAPASATAALHPALGWIFFLPGAPPLGPRTGLPSAAWVLALLAPALLLAAPRRARAADATP
ncbi:MAG: VanZ family protein [Gemmatimonadales bacterium]|nr:VanZ family protein [Gemmatimonadales bacterium]